MARMLLVLVATMIAGCAHYHGSSIETGVTYSDNRPTFSASFKINFQ